jgi:hypothetical protein
MTYLTPPQVVFTNKCKNQMSYHNLTENDVLYTFNYPQATSKAWYGRDLHNNERDFGDYKVTVVYRWDQHNKKWILVTCWRVTQIKRRSIKWWFANILGKPY